MKMNAKLEARKALYQRLYALRLQHPVVFGEVATFTCHSLEAVADVAPEPYLSAALTYATELGHLDVKDGCIRLNLYGEQYVESEGWVIEEESEQA